MLSTFGLKKRNMFTLASVNGAIKRICFNISVSVKGFATVMNSVWRKIKGFIYLNVRLKPTQSSII